MRRVIWLGLACWACTTPTPRSVPAPTPGAAPFAVASSPAPRPTLAWRSDPEGELDLSVFSSKADSTAFASTPLGEAETAALLARLEPLPVLDNAHPAVMRPPSAKPSSPGTATPIAFVAPTGRAVADRPIAAASVQPDQVIPMQPPQILPAGGEAVLGAELRVRFADPMVAVAEIGAARAAIATIDPPIAGTWRWNDTREAQLTPAAGRLPASTKITVTVPAGLRSITGTVLDAPVTATFTTPTVMIDGTYPRDSMRPDAPIVVRVNQAVDPDAIATLMHLTVKGAELPFRRISLDEAKPLWAKQPHLKIDLSAIASDAIIVAPQGAWPSGRDVLVTLAKGAPSREGPLVTSHAEVGTFRVAPAFELLGLACDGEKPRMHPVCPALSWTSVEMTNPIETSSYHAEFVQLAGRPFEDHPAYGSTVLLESLPDQAGVTLTLAIGEGLVDMYGQPYTGPHRVPFRTTRPHWHEYLGAESGLYVLDPRYQIPQWQVDADAVPSMRVQLYAVEPTDYFAYTRTEADPRQRVPGKRVFDREYRIGERFAGQARVDLRPALHASGTGHVIAIATAGKLRDVAWIEVTKLGVVARIDGEQASAWVSDIAPSSFMTPLPNAETRLVLEHGSPTSPISTDADGHAALGLPGPATAPNTPEHDALLTVATPNDVAFVPIDREHKSIRTRTAEWYVADDRFTYKPGEPLYIKGWLRWTHDGANPGIELPPAGERVTYAINDVRGVELAKGTAALTAEGGFDFEVALPSTANLGMAQVTLAVNDQKFEHPFAIEEFRTPAYQVTLDDDVLGGGTLPLVLGESIEMRAEARYYGGGGLDGAAIAWDAKLRAASYRPAGFDGFDFTPVSQHGDRQPTAHADARLGTGSTATVSFGIAALPLGAPSLLEVDTTVTDVDRQTIRASSRAIVVHPSSYYVGLRMKPESYDTVEVVVVDLDSHAVAGVPIDIAFSGVNASERYRDDAVVKDTQHCKATSAKTPVTCTFHSASNELVYIATAHVNDARNRPNTAWFIVPRWGGPAEHTQLDVTADKPSYRAGDVAKLTIFSDVVPSRAVVSYARQGLVAQRVVELAKPETTISVPIEVSYLEDVHVIVDRFAPRLKMLERQASKDPLPEHVQTEVDLAIDKRGAKLAVTATPSQPSVGPGEPASFDVAVARDGKPVAGAEVALIVVDEAVLALSGKHHQDPLEPFYRTVENGTEAASSFELVRDAGEHVIDAPGFDRENLDLSHIEGFGTGEGYGMGYGRGGYSTVGHGSGVATIESRKDFRATAVWSPRLVTDANGHAHVIVKMPDSLTRFRIVALAAKDAYYFGVVEGAIATRREVNARIVAPRFLTQGDAFELPVVVQNLDSHPRTIAVVARAANLAIDGPAGKRVTLPAGQRAEVHFAFHTQARGKAAIETAIQSGDRSDGSTIELPVYAPATTESFATYGIVDDAPMIERLDVPADIYPEVGGVEAELSSTQLQALTDAYWYLQAYPYECAEQRSSRMLATAAMADVLDAFAVPGRPTRDELAAQHAKDVEKLVDDQLADGTWGYWPDSPSNVFVTMQVMQALAHEPSAAKAVAKARANVGKLAAKLIASLAARPDARAREATAYDVMVAADALASLAAIGTDERATAQRLHAIATRLGVYPLDAKARVLAIVAKQPAAAKMRAELVQLLAGASRETAAGASVSEAYASSLASLLPSTSRTSALVLDAMMREAPSDPLIAKLARGLLAAQHGGRWRTTQENLVVLQAMRRYFDTYEHVTPDFTGKLWLGDADYAEHAFVGHTTERADAALGWAALTPGSRHDIALAKAGPGRMYYRIGITYAPSRATVAALDAGFIVRRVYEAVDDPNDVVKTPGGWTIRLGARVRVRLEASSTTPNDNVALVDPLPAGFEAVNTHLATAERAAPDTAVSREWRHVEMRDDRTEAFALVLDPGAHQFEYTVRATTPGTFVAAPTKAEDMYAPETFGRTASEVVTIR